MQKSEIFSHIFRYITGDYMKISIGREYRTLTAQPTLRWYPLVQRIRAAMPQFARFAPERVERQLEWTLIFESRRTRRVNTYGKIKLMPLNPRVDFKNMNGVRSVRQLLNPFDQFLANYDMYIPDIVTRSVMSVARQLGIGTALSRNEVISNLINAGIFGAPTENDKEQAETVFGQDPLLTRAVSVVSKELGVKPLGGWLTGWYEGQGYPCPTRDHMVSFIDRKLGAGGFEVWAVPRAEGRTVIDREWHKMSDIDTAFERILTSIIASVLANKSEMMLINELTRWYQDYLTLLAETVGQKGQAFSADALSQLNGGVLSLYERLRVLEKAVTQERKLKRKDIALPESFRLLDRDVVEEILNDLLKNACGCKSLSYMALPEILIVNKRNCPKGIVNINGVNYDLSRYGDCLVLPFYDFARVYNFHSGERRGDFTYAGATASRVVTPTLQEEALDHVFVASDKRYAISVGVSTRVYFYRSREYAGSQKIMLADKIVRFHGLFNVYDQGGNFIGAVPVDALNSGSSRGEHVPDISTLLHGAALRVASTFFTHRRIRYNLVFGEGRSDFVFEDFAVDPVDIWNLGYVYARKKNARKRELLGAVRLRDKLPAKGAPPKAILLNVPLTEIEAEVPLLGARALRVYEKPGNSTRYIQLRSMRIHLGPWAQPGTWAYLSPDRRQVHIIHPRGKASVIPVEPDQATVPIYATRRYSSGLIPRSFIKEPDTGGVISLEGTRYGTGNVGPVEFVLMPEEGGLPFGRTVAGRFILEGSPFRFYGDGNGEVAASRAGRKTKRRGVFVGDLLQPFQQLKPSGRLLIGGVHYRVPGALQYFRALHDYALFTDRAGSIIQCVDYRLLAEHGLANALEINAGIEKLEDIQSFSIYQINHLYELLHRAGVRLVDVKEGNQLSFSQCLALLSFMRSYEPRERSRAIETQLRFAGRSFILNLGWGGN
ncbi:MAG: hypothetical protein KKB81_08320 [Candidatus Margulisbacteria bacterium]|nr:hypothetical protein [Candidatus Margulisiibacteriota bacterium]MBU1021699.1 hypothetical protein [Candidatus Margulisiibacteriota bacterium]MBU1729445.1 hypothetical protein [Candidatus Margulisiibacteriota bacterium]MBU1955454.1 hypothetical protein [Candidatus Margulisiibacteriota bacterium]